MINKILGEIISVLLKLIFIAVAVLVIVESSKWAYKEGYSILSSANNGEIRTVLISIPKGSNTEQIANILHDSGLVSSTLYFRFMSKLNGLENKYQYGEYTLSTANSQDEIMKILTTEGAKKEVKQFTLVEGLTLDQTAASLAKQGICSKSDFYDALSKKWGYNFLDSIPEERKIKFQGYILPDTYEVYADAKPEQVIGVIFDEMNKIWTEENIAKANSMGYTIDQILTVASIIEKEVVDRDEQALVSSVIYNRLDKNMPLQMCSTIMYVLEVPRDRLFYEDLEKESPYNTYKNIGLPVGPICNPGKSAILAALEPKDTDYLFFVLKDDGSRTHNFNSTLEGHNSDKQKYKRTFNP